MTLNPAARFGPYEIMSPLGAGGMGEVYHARDTRLDRSVAIKVLPERLSGDAMARQRLEREARAVSSLNHPHICSLYDIGQQDGRYYLVLELLQGEVLAHRLKRGALPLDEALRVAREIADALHAAHRQGVVHRDLKPGNVMLTKSGAKLLDFGLALSTATQASTSSLTAAPTATSPLTAEGMVAGTLQYMAPEQLETGQSDVRSDVFAFGVLLYEMVTGRRAFPGKTQASLIAEILKEQPPPVSELIPLASPELDRLLRRCLSKDPDERRQSMKDVLIDLEWISEAESRDSPMLSASRRWTGPAWTLAVLSALLAVALGVTLMSRSHEQAPVIRALLPLPEKTVFNYNTVNPGPPVISPDGRRIVFAAMEEDGAVRLWLRDLDDLTATPIPGTEGGGYPFWSPDGKSVGFFSKGDLYRVDLGLGRPFKLCDAPTGKGGTWNRDGTILFAPSFNSGIHRVSHDGGKSTPVTGLSESEREYSHRFPFFLPDGRHFLYMVQFKDFYVRDPAIMIVSLDGGAAQLITVADSHAIFSSGHLLYLLDENLIARPFDPVQLQATEEAFSVVEAVAQLPGTGRGIFSASQQGVLIYRHAPGEVEVELQWVDREGELVENLGKLASPFDGLAVAPDGGPIALAMRGSADQDIDIWLYNPDSKQKSRFTFGVEAVYPVWSPDGQSLVFIAVVDGTAGLFRKFLHGSDMIPLNLPFGIPVSYSPDGRRLAMMIQGEDSGADIWIASPSGDHEAYPYIHTRSLEVIPRFSPDGRWIAYSSDETGRFEIYVASVEKPESRWQVSTGGGQWPMWRADGKELYYYDPATMLMAAQVETEGSVVKVRSSEELFQLDSRFQSAWQGYGVSPDGKRFLIQTRTTGEDPYANSLTLVSDWRPGRTD